MQHIKHSTYLFSWNDDISGVRNTIIEACRPLKLLSGLSLDEFTNNTQIKKFFKFNIVQNVVW